MTDKTIDHDENEPKRGTALVATFDMSNPAMAFEKPESVDALFGELERRVRGFQHDMSTAAGRKRTTALAMEVVRTKTALDAAGKSLNDEARQRINKVDEARRSIRDRADALAEEARKPLRDWEAAEEERVKRRDAQMQMLRTAGLIDPDETAEDIKARLVTLEALTLSKEDFAEAFIEAEGRLAQAIASLRNGVARIEREEADRAELARLREQQAERDRVAEAERLEREAREAEERRQREEKEAAEAAARQEAERIQREKEERERREREELERIARAEEAARKEVEERAAREVREAEERAAKERLEQEERHAAELRRIEQEQATRQREAEAAGRRKTEEERIAREAEEKRQKNVKHRTKVMELAGLALVKEAEISEAQAKAIILAIVNGRVPQVVVQF